MRDKITGLFQECFLYFPGLDVLTKEQLLNKFLQFYNAVIVVLITELNSVIQIKMFVLSKVGANDTALRSCAKFVAIYTCPSMTFEMWLQFFVATEGLFGNFAHSPSISSMTSF